MQRNRPLLLHVHTWNKIERAYPRSVLCVLFGRRWTQFAGAVGSPFHLATGNSFCTSSCGAFLSFPFLFLLSRSTIPFRTVCAGLRSSPVPSRIDVLFSVTPYRLNRSIKVRVFNDWSLCGTQQTCTSRLMEHRRDSTDLFSTLANNPGPFTPVCT